MSLINKVLKEIENRQQNTSTANKETITLGLNSLPNKYNIKLISLITGIIVLSLGLVFITIQKFHKIQQKAPSAKIAPTNTLVSKNPYQTNATNLPVKLENIALNVEKNKTTINFFLNQSTLYFLAHDDTERHLSLTLSNTKLLKQPAINLANTVIREIKPVQSGNNTVVNIDVASDTQIIGLQMITQPKPELQLTLLNSNTPTGVIHKTNHPFSKEEISEQYYQKATALISEEKNDSAIDTLYKAVSNNPNNKKAREALVSLLVKNGDLTSANEMLQPGLKANPEYSPFTELQAYIYMEKNQKEKAIKSLEANPPPIESDTSYFGFLANLYQQTGQYMSAARLYDQLTKIEPTRGIWWVGLGISLESAQKINAANEAYQNALATSDLTTDLKIFVENKIKG
jgi:Flp pilus assembly protein TadD